MQGRRIVVVAVVAAFFCAAAQAQLFAGLGLNPIGPPSNPAVVIDVLSDTSVVAFAGRDVGGATNDPFGQRCLFTSSSPGGIGYDELWEWPHAGGAPSLLGTITNGGNPFRIDGLAMVMGGTLYGSRAAASNDGLFEIDLGTLAATQVGAFTDSISGIDAHPVTGVMYGANDSTGQIVEISPTGGLTDVGPYPPTRPDLDGVAVGPDGRLYLVPDDNSPGEIFVFDLKSSAYLPSLTAPWSATSKTFSGACFITTVVPVDLQSFDVE